MAISQSEVKKIAHLARLKVTEAQVEAYKSNLDNILNLVHDLSATDTTGVEPMAHPFDADARLREDLVTEPDLCEALMALAPESAMGLYLVPQVIE